jgi:hypothetical protein
VKDLTLTSHHPGDMSTISVKIRGEQTTIPVLSDELKKLFGEPDSVRQFTVGRART